VAAIGWDVVSMLVPFLGHSETRPYTANVLDVVVEKGNAKEVFLKCTEALKRIPWREEFDDDEDNDGEATLAEKLTEFTKDESENDQIGQVSELYRATQTGISCGFAS
jgi:hypothetical protein